MPKIKIGDAQVHYNAYGSGEPVLLIGGLASDLNVWKSAVPRLGNQFRVISFDNRGVGLTEAPAEAFTMQTFADDAASLLEGLKIERAHVVGWSMGGAIAQELALRHPRRVGALVLMSTFTRIPDRSRFAIDAMLHSVLEGASIQTFMMMMQAWCSTNHAFEGREATWAQDAPMDRRTSALAEVAGYARQKQALDAFDTRERARLLAAPTLVVHGVEDVMVPPSFAHHLAAQIPGAQLCWVEGAGHFLPASGWTGPTAEFLASHPFPSIRRDP